jgi:hypothetical protein
VNIMELGRTIKEDFKAWRRGERRVAPGLRGRVYVRKEDEAAPPDDGVKRSPHKANLKLSARVTRADGTIENYTITDGKAVRAI